ncbi:MAG: hypothetical protein AB1512_25145 [Thermodesulfobacteriota bacterium]
MWILDFVNEFLRHPIVIAVFSSGMLAVLVSKLGARLQHENWRKQEEMTRKKVAQEKLFDKRAEIIRRVFYLMKKREQVIWNSYHANKRQREAIKKGSKEFIVLFAQEAKEYRDLEQEVVSESNGLVEEMKIFFGVSEQSEEANFLKCFLEIDKIWHGVSYKIAREEMGEDYINDESKKVDERRKRIHEGLRHLVYRNEPNPKEHANKGALKGVNASTPDIAETSSVGVSPDHMSPVGVNPDDFRISPSGVTRP